MVTKTRRTAIGTRKAAKKIDRVALLEASVKLGTDAGQLGKSIARSDYTSARRQVKQLIRTLQKLPL